MLVRGGLRLVPVVGPMILLVWVLSKVYYPRDSSIAVTYTGGNAFSPETDHGSQPFEPFPNEFEEAKQESLPESPPTPVEQPPNDPDNPTPVEPGTGIFEGLETFTPRPVMVVPPDYKYNDIENVHRRISSLSTADQKYFPIIFGDDEAINPNIIPHPTLNETWIIVAMLQKSNVERSVWFAEIGCDATFRDGALRCLKPPNQLPIAATEGGSFCPKSLDFFNLNIGPHDGRVFYGPHAPYTIYGSNSKLTCFGQWAMDFRMLYDWGFEIFEHYKFRRATELRRPPPYGNVEKNWFLFWDKDEQMYAHYDVFPKRVFAKLEWDGSIGEDLALAAKEKDEICMEKYMPKPAKTLESVHQATNSLSITLCKRTDTTCTPNSSNTFILSIFQHKTYYLMHSLYEPYIMLFKQEAPFEIHAISKKPLWINGRGLPGSGLKVPGLYPEEDQAWQQTEMFYVTSMSWKQQGQRYHGYVDDVIFLAFGIEDLKTGGIDILAGDLLQDLGICGL